MKLLKFIKNSNFIWPLWSHCDNRGKYYKIERYIYNQQIFLILNKMISNNFSSFTTRRSVQIHVFKIKHFHELSSLGWKSVWETFSNNLKCFVLFDCNVHCSDIFGNKFWFHFQMLGYELARRETAFGK